MKPIPITGLPAGATVEGQVYEDATVAYLFDKLATIRLANGVEVQVWWEAWNKTHPFVVRAVYGCTVKETLKTGYPDVAVGLARMMAWEYHTDDNTDAVAVASERVEAAMNAYEATWSRAGGYAFLATMSGLVAAVLMLSFNPGDWPIQLTLAVGLACWATDLVAMSIAMARLSAAMTEVSRLIDEDLREGSA